MVRHNLAGNLEAAEQAPASSYDRVRGKLLANMRQLSALADDLAYRQKLPGDEVRAVLSVPTMTTELPGIPIMLAAWTPDNDTSCP